MSRSTRRPNRRPSGIQGPAKGVVHISNTEGITPHVRMYGNNSGVAKIHLRALNGGERTLCGKSTYNWCSCRWDVNTALQCRMCKAKVIS